MAVQCVTFSDVSLQSLRCVVCVFSDFSSQVALRLCYFAYERNIVAT
jgi:hypothetical protein